MATLHAPALTNAFATVFLAELTRSETEPEPESDSRLDEALLRGDTIVANTGDDNFLLCK